MAYNLVEEDLYNYIKKLQKAEINIDEEEIIKTFIYESHLSFNSFDYLRGRCNYPRDFLKTWTKYAELTDEKVMKKSKTEEAILAELENHPEKFSPNALMRPVYQETILPNLAYIGGNAEIMYWLELKDYFSKIETPFPLLIPRNSMLCLAEKTISKTKSFGLEIKDFFRNFASVTNEILLEKNEILPLLNKDEAFLEKHFEELAVSANATHSTFGNLVQAEKTRQLKSFDRMRKRLLRAEKIKQS